MDERSLKTLIQMRKEEKRFGEYIILSYGTSKDLQKNVFSLEFIVFFIALMNLSVATRNTIN